jgi:hypothetical protein
VIGKSLFAMHLASESFNGAAVQPRVGGNEPGTGSVVLGGRSYLVCSCHLHARGERCCGRAASGIWGSRVENRPGYRTERTRIQPL